MKKFLPLLTLSILLLGCESRVDKLKVACSNVDAFSNDPEHKAKYEKQVIQLAELPTSGNDLYSEYPAIFCDKFEEY